jgi:PKD repeat protein
MYWSPLLRIFTYISDGRTVYFAPETPFEASYRWTFGDGDSSKSPSPSHTYKADSGTYTVCLAVTNAENCSQKVCKSVYFNVGMDELEKGIKVYPNPAEKTLYIESNSSYPILHVTLQDLQGRMLYQSDCRNSNCEIDVLGWRKGMYMLTVQTEKGIWREKVEVGR